MELDKMDDIFECCDVDQSGDLNFSELQNALQALGLYPNIPDINKNMKKLDLHFLLNKPAFRKIAGVMQNSGCARRLHSVPHALRGITLEQLKALQAGFCETRWLKSLCKKFNEENMEEILGWGRKSKVHLTSTQ